MLISPDVVSPEMQDLIKARLKDIEAEENIRVLFAIESGSRAWGFHSPDSDYDVRFVYARPLDWHLSLQKKRDVVERPIDDELDISGWELSKTLQLIMGSNAVVPEWLQSPIVYSATPEAVQDLTDFCRTALDRRSVTWHYLSLMQRQQSRLHGPEGEIRLKRYFYILRPTLALRWMRLNDKAVAPMNMDVLVSGCELSERMHKDLADLTEQKKQAREKAFVSSVSENLVALVADEEAQARDWLAATRSDKARDVLWQEADRLHMKWTQGAFK